MGHASSRIWHPPTTEELAYATQQALIVARANFSQLNNPAHSMTNVETSIVSAANQLAERGPRHFRAMLNQHQAATRLPGTEGSTARLIVAGMKQLADRLDVTIDAKAMAPILARIRRRALAEARRHEAARQSHPTSVRDLRLIVEDLRPLEALTTPYSLNAYEQHMTERGLGFMDMVNQASYYSQFLNHVADRISKAYIHGTHHPVLFFDETVDMVAAAHPEWEGCQHETMLRQYVEMFRRHIKKHMLGQKDAPMLRDALDSAIAELLPPLVNGSTHIPLAQRPNIEGAEKIARDLQQLVSSYKPQYDVAKFFQQSDAYTSSCGNLRRFANQLLSHTMETLHLEQPPLPVRPPLSRMSAAEQNQWMARHHPAPPPGSLPAKPRMDVPPEPPPAHAVTPREKKITLHDLDSPHAAAIMEARDRVNRRIGRSTPGWRDATRERPTPYNPAQR